MRQKTSGDLFHNLVNILNTSKPYIFKIIKMVNCICFYHNKNIALKCFLLMEFFSNQLKFIL